jgi:hypothetical protein
VVILIILIKEQVATGAAAATTATARIAALSQASRPTLLNQPRALSASWDTVKVVIHGRGEDAASILLLCLQVCMRDQRRHVSIVIYCSGACSRRAHILYSLQHIQIVQTITHQLKKVITVVDIRQILHTHKDRRHCRHIQLNLKEVILIHRQILQCQIDVVENTLAVKAGQRVYLLLRVMGILIDQLKLATLKVLTNPHSVVSRRSGPSSADKQDLNRVRAKGRHLGCSFR